MVKVVLMVTLQTTTTLLAVLTATMAIIMMTIIVMGLPSVHLEWLSMQLSMQVMMQSKLLVLMVAATRLLLLRLPPTLTLHCLRSIRTWTEPMLVLMLALILALPLMLPLLSVLTQLRQPLTMQSCSMCLPTSSNQPSRLNRLFESEFNAATSDGHQCLP